MQWLRRVPKTIRDLAGVHAPHTKKWMGASVACAGTYCLASSLATSEPATEKRSEHRPHLMSNGLKEGKDFLAYDHKGRVVKFHDVIQAALATTKPYPRVVFLGEYHDDPVAHALELEIFTNAVRVARSRCQPGASSPAGSDVALSLEMFERDVQVVMDEYLGGFIRESDLVKDGRAWPNYSNYRPMVELARQESIPVICANAPRRYVSLAGRSGRASLQHLPSLAASFLPPLPYPSPSDEYVQKTNGLMAQAAEEMKNIRADRARADEDEHATSNHDDKDSSKDDSGCPYIGFNVSTEFMDAQCLWDTAMASSIANHIEKHPEALVVHVCGKFHVDGRLGIPEHLLASYRPDTHVSVISFVPAEAVVVPEGGNLLQMVPESAFSTEGDFVVLTNALLPRSFEINHPV